MGTIERMEVVDQEVVVVEMDLIMKLLSVTPDHGIILMISLSYASNRKTPTEKCGSPSSPVSLSEYYTKTVQSIKHKFNDEIDETKFREKHKDFCRLLFFDELWNFNKNYVQLAELN